MAKYKSVEDIFLSYLYLVIKFKYWIVLGAVVGLVIGFLLSKRSKVKTYTATAVIYPDEAKTPTAAVPYLLEQLSGSGNSLSSLVPIFKSRALSEQVVKCKIKYYDHLDSVYVYDVVLAEQSQAYKKYKGGRHFDELTSKNKEETKNKIYLAAVAVKSSMTFRPDNIGFMEISSTWADNPKLPGYIVNLYIQEFIEFDARQKYKRAKRNYELIKTRYDSLKANLEAAEKTLAQFNDANQNNVKEVALLSKIKLTRELELQESIYRSIALQLAEAEIGLTRKVPIIQVLDYPQPPYKVSQNSSIRSIVLGVVAGLLFVLILITIMFLYRADYKIKEVQA
ncbi:MAG: Wzz/FepE/Etk N-terminal domain-containing protein [Bacteroidia bacterium]|nr:Wzz/FepE/Etk N-terminal domain-containing protein [Bacteroidia bacterium]MDW8346214.1 Wzz/FepE/Etk N-terminal domain-containing protein [Bacteroidia bacterium]